MPAGAISPFCVCAPGCFSVRYIRSSKLTRLRLNAVVSALARLLATTSIRVDNARSPVAAESRAVIAMGSLSDRKAGRDYCFSACLIASGGRLPDLPDLVPQLAEGLV